MANVYYSVCTFGTGDIMTGSPTLTMSSGVATFSVAQTGNIGVGCRVTYNTNSIAYISVMTNSTTATLVTAIGGTPADEGSAVTVNSIAHEYASLSAFEAGFTDSNHTNNIDISTATGADMIVHACCYYDHVDQTADTTAVTISYGTADTGGYLKAFTPTGGVESINSQRSTTGIFDTNKYNLTVSGSVISNQEIATKLVGLQVRLTATGTYDIGINVSTLGTPIDVVISHNIIDFINPTTSTQKGINVSNDAALSADIYNNVVYNSGTLQGNGIYVENGTVDISNNTVYNFTDGIEVDAGTIGLYNNAVFNCTDDIDPGAATITSNYNATEEGYGTNAVTITQTASDFAALVTDAVNYDFSVTDSSSELYNAGFDSSSYGVTDDIISTARPQSTSYDVGAFELIVAAAGGRIMSSIAAHGGLAAYGGIAGKGGGLAG